MVDIVRGILNEDLSDLYRQFSTALTLYRSSVLSKKQGGAARSFLEGMGIDDPTLDDKLVREPITPEREDVMTIFQDIENYLRAASNQQMRIPFQVVSEHSHSKRVSIVLTELLHLTKGRTMVSGPPMSDS